MSKYFSKEDIYDNNGILLLSKGQEMTDVVITKLKKLERYKPEQMVNFDAEQSIVFTPIIQALRVKMNIHDDCVLEQSNKILSTIIFESKTKPWWIFVNALSNHVDWLYAHSINVSIISMMMAEELGYNDEELWNIGLGAFLHNVGKLLIPKAIIQKSDSLNYIEMVYMRQYCELGMSSLKPFDLSKNCLDIVLQHHERLDGSGYPNGLKEDEICQNAKIVMIADVLDVLTSGRPYRQALEIDVAINVLRNDKGKYCQELITLLEKILK